MQLIEEEVKETMAKLIKAQKIRSYQFINKELVEKRLLWYEENKDKISLKGSDVRKAYTLLLIEYIGLDPEVPVVYEDKSKIAWRSYNFCTTLEACKRLGMDTRDLFKKAQERSV